MDSKKEKVASTKKPLRLNVESSDENTSTQGKTPASNF